MPFAVLPWKDRDSVGEPDPWGSGSGENAKIGMASIDLLFQRSNPLIATWDSKHEDASRLASLRAGTSYLASP